MGNDMIHGTQPFHNTLGTTESRNQSKNAMPRRNEELEIAAELLRNVKKHRFCRNAKPQHSVDIDSSLQAGVLT